MSRASHLCVSSARHTLLDSSLDTHCRLLVTRTSRLFSTRHARADSSLRVHSSLLYESTLPFSTSPRVRLLLSCLLVLLPPRQGTAGREGIRAEAGARYSGDCSGASDSSDCSSPRGGTSQSLQSPHTSLLSLAALAPHASPALAPHASPLLTIHLIKTC